MSATGWVQFAGLLFLETTAIVLLAAAAARFLSDPRGRAMLWQATFLALAVTLAMRLSNLEIGEVRGNKPRSVQARVLEETQESAVRTAPDSLHEASQPQRNGFNWPFWLWIGGAALLLARTAQAQWLLRRALGRAKPASPRIVEIVETLRLRIAAPAVAVASWNELPTPCVFGIRRATLALPTEIEDRVAPAQLEAMLAHEIAHVAARDPLWSLASELIAVFLWWHPAVWFARRALLNASELAADQASHCLPEGPTALAESLVYLGRELSGDAPRALPVLGGGGLRSGLGRRVEALLQDRPRWTPIRPGRAWIWRASLMAAAIALAAPLPHAQLPAPFWHFLAAPAENPATSPAPASAADTNVVGTITGILTDPQFRTVIRALENSGQKNPALDAHIAPASPITGSVTIRGGEPDPLRPPGQSATLSVPAPSGPAAVDSNRAVTLRFEIAEISEQTPSLGLDWIFGKVREKEPTRLATAPPYRVPGNEPIRSENVQVEHLRFEEQFAILTSDQYSELRGALERQSGVDLLSAPKVTTVSGRQAQISVLDVQTLVTGGKTAIDGTDTVPVEHVSFGQVVDVTPSAVGESWHLPVVASYVEFLGYDAELRPRIRVRDAVATATVSFGETLVIRGVPVTDTKRVEGGLFRRDKIQELQKRIYIFVTPERPKN